MSATAPAPRSGRARTTVPRPAPAGTSRVAAPVRPRTAPGTSRRQPLRDVPPTDTGLRPTVPPPPPLRVVDPPSTAPRPRASRGVFALVVAGLLTAGLLALLAVHTAMAQGAFELHRLERDAALLAEQEQRLQQELALEAAPERLAERATALGMVPSENPAFIRAADGAILGEPMPGRTPLPDGSLAPAAPAPEAAAEPAEDAAADPAAEPARADAAADAAAPADGQPAGGEAEDAEQ